MPRETSFSVDANPRAVAAVLAGWAPVIRAGAAFYNDVDANPLVQVLAICRGMERDARDWIGRAAPDPRLRRISELLEDVASSPIAGEDRRQQQAAALHACYITTHAVAGTIDQHAATIRHDEVSRPLSRLVGHVGARIRTAEQILDTHLGHAGSNVLRPQSPAQGLRDAIAGWDGALHEALVDQTPDPRVLLVSANASIGLLRRTADLSTLLAVGDDSGSVNVRLRLLPMLPPATATWEQARDTWRTLAPRTTGIARPIAVAAQALFRALQSPGLAADHETPNAIRLGLLASVETAHLHLQAVRRSDLRGAAGGVSALTQMVFEQVPGVRSLDLWRQLERLDGPALIAVPGPVRSELLRQAARTLEATTMAASSSHSLIVDIRRPSQTRDVHRHSQVGPPAVSARDLSAHSAPRTGR